MRSILDAVERRLADAANELDEAISAAQRPAELARLTRTLSINIDQALCAVQTLTEHFQRDGQDKAYERAAARARANNFAETGGKDWT